MAPMAGGPGFAPGGNYQSGAGYWYGEIPHIPNYLVQAILVTICCCVPAGIVAIVFAAQVNGKVQSGDYAEAMRLSNNAKTWCWVSFGLAIAAVVIYVILVAAGIASSGF